MTEKESEKLRRQFLLMQACLLKIRETVDALIEEEFTDREKTGSRYEAKNSELLSK